MKNLYILCIICIALFSMSCVQNAAEQSSATSDNSAVDAKGQSAVQDDLSEKNILQVALGSKDHTTLVAAVQAAELEDVLVNAGPLTVFAPTNDAFAALPEETLNDLLKPENKAQLARIIKYHASPGKYMGNGLRDNMNLYQASGHYIKITNADGKVQIGEANILGTVEASNGVVHVIDKVLVPSS